jgi:hypothetical protein
MKAVSVLLASVAVGALLVVQVAAAGGNELLAKGNVTYHVGGALSLDATVSFHIHARGNGESSGFEFSNTLDPSVRSYDSSVCVGSYTDPIKGGTDLYFVGARISGPANPIYSGFIIHEGGPLGADYAADVLASGSLAGAQQLCSRIERLSPSNAVTATSDLLFKV